MSHRLLLTAAAALLAGPALAGGFSAPVVTPPVAPPPVVPTVVAPSADWSGAYAGGQLGYGRLSVDDGSDLIDSLVEEDSYNGALYGLHAGYRFDFGRVVAGAEIDFDGTQIEVDAEDIDATDPTEVGSIRRLKAQLGFDAGNFLPYVTAGVAQAVLNSDDEAVDDEIGGTNSGRFVGLGASYMVSDRLMVGVEALRHNFDDFDGTAVEGSELDVNTITLRGSFRF